MASNIVFNGVTYSIPAVGDDGWGPDLTAYFIAIASAALQKTGGSFTLTAETDFGAGFGLKSVYFKSRAANPATVGQIRLGNQEGVFWRNAANNDDKALVMSASDKLEFDGDELLISGQIRNADIAADAAIAYSKLALGGSIVNLDISDSAGIVYSKLSLSNSIVNTDVAAGAAIAYSKLAALTASRVLVSDGSGVISVSSVTSTTLGYLDVSSSLTTQLAAKVAISLYSAKGVLLAGSGAGTVGALSPTTDGFALILDSSQTVGMKWAATLSNPMTTGGDLIYGGASGTPTRLPNGSSGQYLASAGGTSAPVWTSLPRSSVFVDTGNGYGSTETKVRRFTNARLNTGSAITYADSSVNGTTFTINEDGVYAITYSDGISSGTPFIAITVNASGTTNANSLTYATGRRGGVNLPSGLGGATSWTGFLSSGDVVRAQSSGTNDQNDAFCNLSIVKVSN